MDINRIGISDHHTAWEKRKTEKSIPGTNFAVHMADTNMAIANRDSSTTGRRTTFTDKEEDTNTHSEVIVRPDGSRVLMITMDIGGTQATMSLQISEPTDMRNDISMSKDDRSETPANAAVLTSDEISGSVSEE